MPKMHKVYIGPFGESQSVRSDATALEFRFEDGTKERLEFARLSEETKTCATGHGLSQKVGDEASGAAREAEEQGLSWSQAARARIQSMIKRLYAGDWTSERTVSVTSLFAEALARAPGIAPHEAAMQIGLKIEEFGGRDTPVYKAWEKKVKAHPAVKKGWMEVDLERKRAAAERAARRAIDAPSVESLF